MELITTRNNLHMDVPTAVTIGKFDGLHRGHMLLIDRIRKSGLKTCVITVLTGEVSLMTAEERRRKLENCGIDVLVELTLDGMLADMSPDTFLNEVLIKELNMEYLAVGPDFRFGARAAGDVAFLKEHETGFKLEVVPKLDHEGSEISSTRIRQCLQEGHPEAAEAMLGYPYSFTGKVTHGQHVGRKLGVPTVNVDPEKGKMIPAKGVYLSTILLPDGTRECGMTNIGVRPTVEGDDEIHLEMHIFWFDGDLYGAYVTIELLEFIRPEQKFETLDALKEQLKIDELIGKLYFHRKGEIEH